MASSNREKIVAAIETAMKAINGTGSYVNNVNGNVSIWKTEETQGQEMPFIWIKDGVEEFSAFATGGAGKGKMQAKLEVKLLGAIAGNNGTNTKAVAMQARTLLTDMFTALNVDPSWGVLNCQTQPKATDVQVDQGNKLVGWAYLELSITYIFNRFDYTS